MSFKKWLEGHEPKELILIRGVSGAGKSTIAKELLKSSGAIYSTDDFFMKDGKYQFDPKKLSINHQLNVSRTENAMKEGISPIIIDNTNLQAWEMKPYVNLADKYEYHTKIVETESPDIQELLKRQENRKNINKNLSKETLEKMLNKYQKGITLDDIKKSKSPF